MAENNELRAKVKKCINALNSQQPIVFGNPPLIQGGRDASLYVKGLHGGDSDLISNLADRIDLDEGGGTYLFSGNRGTGKTTELMRLADLLRQQGSVVFYVDMAEYMNLTSTVEITDFLISMLGGFSEKIEERFGKNPSGKGFFERMGQFLQSEITVDGIDLKAGSDITTTLKMSLHQDPDFKEKLQKGTRGHVARLVQEARRFVADAIAAIRTYVAENKKIVLIVDSFEKLRGVGDSKSIAKVFKSVEILFSGSSDNLRFAPLYLVCTVPPYLSVLTGSVAAYYSGGQIFMLPSVHVYEEEPQHGAAPVRSDVGLESMLTIVAKRFPEWEEFFTREQLFRLAANSGGDLRDFFRMIDLCIIEALHQPSLPLPDKVIANAESALRNDMPLARDDKVRLKAIQEKHKGEWDNLDDLPNFARLMEGKYILNYRNGDNWFDVHPLLRASVADGA